MIQIPQGGVSVDLDAENALARSIESFRAYDPPPSSEAIVERAKVFRSFLLSGPQQTATLAVLH